MTTLFTGASAGAVAAWLALAVLAPVRRGTFAGMTHVERLNWRMPPLALLKPVAWSPATKLGILLLRGYLVISVLLLSVKAVQLGSG